MDSGRRILSVKTYETLKTILFFYVVLKQSVKAQRHLRARGIITSVREFYTWIAQVM
jgi:sphinganine-1-phosphate aldolase